MTQLVTHKQLTHLVPWWPRFTAANYPQKPSWTDPGHTPHPKVMMCHLKYSSGWSIHQPTSRHHRMYCVGSSTTAEKRPITSLLPIPFIIHKFDRGHSKTLFMWQHYLSLSLHPLAQGIRNTFLHVIYDMLRLFCKKLPPFIAVKCFPSLVPHGFEGLPCLVLRRGEVIN